MPKPNYYYVQKAEGPDLEAVRKAVGAAINFAMDTTKELVLSTVDTKATIDIVRPILGDQAVDQLISNKRIVVNGCTIFLQTKLIRPVGFSKGPVVAIHLPPKQIDKIVDNRTTHLIYVHWNDEELPVVTEKYGPASGVIT